MNRTLARITDSRPDLARPVMWAAVGLAVLTVIRFGMAAITPLAPDEAYYWIWSRALAPGYLDHPPMVALWIRAGTELAGEHPIGVRLLAPLAAAAGSVLLYDAAKRLFPNRRAGLTAALLLNASLAVSAGAVIMTPDTPLLLFWTATLWAAVRLASGGVPAWWYVAGACSGLALLSKYTGAFLPIGLAAYVLIASPGWLHRREPWLAGVLAAALFVPVLWWNAHHDWAGLLRQGSRVSDWSPARAAQYLAELVFGQLGLATPGIAVLFTAGVVLATAMAARTREPGWSLLAAFTVPPALVFAQHAIGDRVQGNWPVILYPAAAIAASGLTGRIWRRSVYPSAVLGFAIAALLYAHVVTALPPFGGDRDPVARQLFGWNELAARAEATRKAAGADLIVAEPYTLAAELSWALPRGIAVVGRRRLFAPVGRDGST